jgi:hypothetical protein
MTEIINGKNPAGVPRAAAYITGKLGPAANAAAAARNALI